MRKAYLLFLLISIPLIITGCSGRNIETLQGSLLGHWKSIDEDGKETHYYIDKQNFTTVINGTKMVYDYKVVSENEETDEFSITTENAEGSGSNYSFTFLNKERTKIESLVNINTIKSTNDAQKEAFELARNFINSLGGSMEVTEEWEYVDSTKQPKK